MKSNNNQSKLNNDEPSVDKISARIFKKAHSFSLTSDEKAAGLMNIKAHMEVNLIEEAGDTEEASLAWWQVSNIRLFTVKRKFASVIILGALLLFLATCSSYVARRTAMLTRLYPVKVYVTDKIQYLFTLSPSAYANTDNDR